MTTKSIYRLEYFGEDLTSTKVTGAAAPVVPRVNYTFEAETSLRSDIFMTERQSSPSSACLVPDDNEVAPGADAILPLVHRSKLLRVVHVIPRVLASAALACQAFLPGSRIDATLSALCTLVHDELPPSSAPPSTPQQYTLWEVVKDVDAGLQPAREAATRP